MLTLMLMVAINASSLLVDSPLDNWGFLLGLNPSDKFIKKGFIKLASKCYQCAFDAVIADPINVLFWKKLLLLPVLLFTKCSKPVMRKRIANILADDWSSFRLRGFVKSCDKKSCSNELSQNDVLFKRMNNNVRVGRLGMAYNYKALCCNVSNAPKDRNTFDKLSLKHPQFAQYGDFDAEGVLRSIRDFTPNEDDLFSISPYPFKMGVMNAKREVSPGLDKLRYEHLKAMVGTSSEMDASELTLGCRDRTCLWLQVGGIHLLSIEIEGSWDCSPDWLFCDRSLLINNFIKIN